MPQDRGGRYGMWLTLAATAVVLGLIGWRLVARADDSAGSNEAAPSRIASDAGAPTVVLSSDALAHAAIVAEPLPAVAYRRRVTAYGSVLDVDSLAAARAELAADRAAATRAAATADAARQELARISTLHADDQNASTRALQAAEATSRGAVAEADAARLAARAEAATVRQQWGPLLGGESARTQALVGGLLSHRAVLLLVALPAGESIASPPARIVVRANGARAGATFVSRAARTDPRTQGETFFYTAPAAAALPANMSIATALPVGATQRVVVVPRSAVVWAEGGAWIYVQTGKGAFTRRAISTDAPTRDGYAEPQLAPGTPVVTRGAQTLLSEEYRSHAQPMSGGDDD